MQLKVLNSKLEATLMTHKTIIKQVPHKQYQLVPKLFGYILIYGKATLS